MPLENIRIRIVAWTRCEICAVFLSCAILGVARAQDPAGTELSGVAWVVEDLRRQVKSSRFAEAWKRVPTVRTLISLPSVSEELRRDAEHWMLAAGLEVVGGAAGLRGKITTPKAETVEVAYDCLAPGWEEDFEFVPALKVGVPMDREERTVFGTGAFCHRAIWGDDVTIEFTGRALTDHDVGPIFLDPDEKQVERFVVGFLNNAFFGIKYGETRSISGGHVLLIAGRGAESRVSDRATQLFGMCVAPPFKRGTEVRFALSLQERKLQLTIGKASVSQQLAPNTQSFGKVRPGLLLHESGFELARIVLRGRPDAQWSDAETARLRKALLETEPKD